MCNITVWFLWERVLPWGSVVSWASAPAGLWYSEVQTPGRGGSWRSRSPPARSERHPWWNQSRRDCCRLLRSFCQIQPQRAPDIPSRCYWQLCSSIERNRLKMKRGEELKDKSWNLIWKVIDVLPLYKKCCSSAFSLFPRHTQMYRLDYVIMWVIKYVCNDMIWKKHGLIASVL